MNTIKKLIFALLALPILLTGCDKNFDKINTSPNSTTSVPTPYILTYVQRELGFLLYDVWNSGRQSELASQHWCQRNYTSEDRYLFRQGTTDAFFRNTYFRLQSCQDIINLNTNDATKGSMITYGDNSMQIATATLLKVWAIQMLAETFGDVPYTEAFQPDVIVQPKYDKQSELFPKLLADATTAVTALKSASNGWSEGDVMFGGDISKWIKFGNSIRLRLVVRMSNVKSDWKAAAAAIINEGVMTSNGDNAIISFIGGGAPNNAPLYDGYVSRNDFTYTKQFMGLLNGVNDTDKGFTNPFNGLVDPRLAVFLGSYNIGAGRNLGVPYGMSDAQTGAYVSANTSKVINLRSTPRPYIISDTYPSTLLDYPTICFLRSEVADWSKTWYENGVRASLAQWGATIDEAYISGLLAKFDAATTEGKKEMVITQKYIHLLTQGFEAWSEYRRTGYPKSLVKPGEVTYNGVVFTPANPVGTDIVPRLMYDSNEYKLNETNVEAAATSIGGDKYTTKLWWAK